MPDVECAETEVCFDFETYPITDQKQVPTPVVMSWSTDGDTASLTTDHDEMLQLATGWLRDPGTVIFAHNAKFDLGILAKLAGGDPDFMGLLFDALDDGRVRCTLQRERLIFLGTRGYLPGGSFNLAACVDRHFDGVDLHAAKNDEFAWRANYNYLDGVPLDRWPEAAVAYSKFDAVITWQLYQRQKKVRNAPDGTPVSGPKAVQNEAPTSRMAFDLRLMTVWGLKLDRERVAEKVADIVDEYEDLYSKLAMTPLVDRKGDGGYKRNMAAIREAVAEGYAAIGKPVPETDTGLVSTSKATIEKVKNESKALGWLYEVSDGSVGKLYSTYRPIIEGAESIHPGYRALVRSGRSSSHHPNIQNIPRGSGVRECFVSRPGYVFVLCDYSTLEFRTWAQACLDLLGYSNAAEALQEGKDVHNMLAAVMRGVTYDPQVADYRGDNGPDVQKEAAEYRQVAKIPNYGVPGGMTSVESLQDYALGYGMELDYETAQYALETYDQTWPEKEDYFNLIKGKCGFEDSMTLHCLRTDRVRADTRFTQAANNLFQSLAADGGRNMVAQLQRACYADRSSVLFGSRPVAYVHDEAIVEVPVERRAACAREVQRIMEDGMAEFCPDVPIEAEPALATRWRKGADPKFNEKGELEVWVDEDDDEMVREAEAVVGHPIHYAQ